MISVSFDHIYLTSTDGIQQIELLDVCTVKDVVASVLSRFPQLYVQLSEDRKLMQRTALILNDDTLLECSDVTIPIQSGDSVHIVELPHGSGAYIVMALEMATETTLSEAGAATLAGVIDALIATAITEALSAIMGAIFGDMAPPDANMGISNSSTYTFDGVKNTTYSGAPIHVVYGTHRAGGNILNVYTTSDYVNSIGQTTGAATWNLNMPQVGNYYTNYLHTQIGLCEGEIESVSDLYINKIPSNFYNGIGTPELRFGTATQEIMLNYNRVESTNGVNRLILNMYRTADNSRVDFGAADTDVLFKTVLSPEKKVYGVLEEAPSIWRITLGAYKIPRVWKTLF